MTHKNSETLLAVAPAASGELAHQEPSSSEDHDSPGLDDVSKAAAFVAVFLYVLGILSVNAYLYRFGVTDVSLLETKYILTGALTAAPLLLGISAPVYAIHMHRITSRRLEAFRQAEARNLYDRVNKRFMIFMLRSRTVKWLHFFHVLLLPWALFLLFPATPDLDVFERILDAGWFYLISASTGLMGLVVVYPVWGKPFPFAVERPAKGIEMFVGVLFFVLTLAIYLSMFANRVYPIVPEQFGGGRARHAVLLVTKDDVAGVAELGIPLDQPSTTAPVSILYEGTDTYVVGLGDGGPVVLSKELVRGFRLVPEPRPRRPSAP